MIEALHLVRHPVELDIHGPVEDTAYWQQCQTLIASLPAHVRVTACGPVSPDAVSATFARYDLFAFPTLGENFGHVIFEALRAGTPVLLSNTTPWAPDDDAAVTILPLEDKTRWSLALDAAAQRDAAQQECLRLAAYRYAERYVAGIGSHRANLEMFHAVVAQSK